MHSGSTNPCRKANVSWAAKDLLIQRHAVCCAGWLSPKNASVQTARQPCKRSSNRISFPICAGACHATRRTTWASRDCSVKGSDCSQKKKALFHAPPNAWLASDSIYTVALYRSDQNALLLVQRSMVNITETGYRRRTLRAYSPDGHQTVTSVLLPCRVMPRRARCRCGPIEYPPHFMKEYCNGTTDPHAPWARTESLVG